MTLRNKAGELFTKTFAEDAEGNFEFITESKWHSVQCEGQKQKEVTPLNLKFQNETGTVILSHRTFLIIIKS